MESEGGGLMGEYQVHYVTYFPKTKNAKDAFLCGLNPRWEYLC